MAMAEKDFGSVSKVIHTFASLKHSCFLHFFAIPHLSAEIQLFASATTGHKKAASLEIIGHYWPLRLKCLFYYSPVTDPPFPQTHFSLFVSSSSCFLFFCCLFFLLPHDPSAEQPVSSSSTSMARGGLGRAGDLQLVVGVDQDVPGQEK